MSQTPDISVVVPAYNEAGNVVPLAREIAAALTGRNFEILFVDDCSTDGTREELIAAKGELPMLRVIGHRHNAGQSRSVRTGVMHARGAIVATLDGDGQNPPDGLPIVIDALMREDAPGNLALVGGDRSQNRQDSAWKKFASRFGNGIRKRMLNDNCNDTGCGLKAFKRQAYRPPASLPAGADESRGLSVRIQAGQPSSSHHWVIEIYEFWPSFRLFDRHDGNDVVKFACAEPAWFRRVIARI